ncbi:hypothetical protein PENTCL1PPCAC_978, partial [Pristionchus entomophagus]
AFRMRSVLALLLLATVAYSAAIPDAPAKEVQLAVDDAAAVPEVPAEYQKPAPVQTGEAKISDGLMCNACKDIVDDVENHEEDTIEAR